MNNITRFSSLFVAVVCLSTVQAQTWTKTTAPILEWQSVACSSDGTKLVAVASDTPGYPGLICTSTDSGATWVTNDTPHPRWSFVTSSGDGSHLVAVVYGGGIFTNSGTTWTQSSAPTMNWWSIASSSDGTQLVVGSEGGEMFISTNAGVAWTQILSAPAQGWSSIACSTDGSKIVAGARYTGGVYTSSNSGTTWGLATNVSVNSGGWVSVASSADGSILVAMGDSIYISTNSGAIWKLANGSPQIPGYSASYVASSADGYRLMVGTAAGLYISSNVGESWMLTSSLPMTFGPVAVSANGHKLVAAFTYDGVYISSAPWVSLIRAVKPAFSDLSLGTNYQLQVSGNLNTWTNQGSPFTATNTSMVYPQYWDVDNWSQLFFRLQAAP